MTEGSNIVVAVRKLQAPHGVTEPADVELLNGNVAEHTVCQDPAALYQQAAGAHPGPMAGKHNPAAAAAYGCVCDQHLGPAYEHPPGAMG